jgi:hypothetical protein
MGADLRGVVVPLSAGVAGASPFGWRLRFGAFRSPEVGRSQASRPDMVAEISLIRAGRYQVECDVAIDK